MKTSKVLKSVSSHLLQTKSKSGTMTIIDKRPQAYSLSMIVEQNHTEGYKYSDAHSQVLQRQPLDWDAIRYTPKANPYDVYYNIIVPWLTRIMDEYPHIMGTIEDIQTDIDNGEIDTTDWEGLYYLVLRVNAQIEKQVSDQFRGEIMHKTPVDIFLEHHPNAIHINQMENVDQQIAHGLPFHVPPMQHTYAQAMSHDAGGLPTYEGHHIYHDTHHRNVTIFLIKINDEPILVATGQHVGEMVGGVYKYRLTWACGGNANWMENYYLDTKGHGPQEAPL